MAKKNEVMNVATEQQMAILDNSYPIDQDSTPRFKVPRLGFLSKDLTEVTGTGKNKQIKVIQSAGTFFKEVETDELNDKGKKVWSKDFFGDQEPIEAIIFFHRKQLRMFDGVDKMFINSPIYDTADEIVPLYKGSSKIDEGTPKALQAKYPDVTQKGKPTSKLKEEKIIYLLLLEDNQVYQMNLSQSSKFEFSDYGRNNKVNRVVTIMEGSEEKTNGSNTFRNIMFSPKRTISKAEADLIVPAVTELNQYVASKNARFSKTADTVAAIEDADLAKY